VAVLALGVLTSTVVLVWHAREMWFFGDEWDFLYHRALSGGDGPGLLAPHNEHWSTIPLILYRVMWQVVGLQHYQVWMLMPILTLMVGSVALYALLRRAGATAWIAVICALVLAWNGAGEDTLWAFQVGFLGSLTAGIIGCLVVQEWQSTRGLVLANAMALVALMCSGLGIPMVAWMTLFALMLRGWRIALSVGTIPTLVYAAWYSAYGVSATEQADQLPDASASAFLAYLWAGISHVWDVTTGMPQVGMAVFLGLAAAAFLVKTTDKLHALAVAGVVTTLFGYAMLAVSRAEFGVEQANSLRYVPLGLVLTLPAFAVAIGLLKARLPARSIERAALAIGLTAFLLASSYASTRTFADNRATFFTGVEERVLLGVHLEESGEPLLRTTLEASNQPPIDVALLSQPGQRDHVPSVDPDEDELWLARAQFRVGATPIPGDLPFAHSVTGVGVGGDLDLSDCSLGATSTLPAGYVEVPAGRQGTQIGLRSPGTSVTVQLVHDGEVSAPASLSTPAGQTVFVATNVPGAALRITPTTPTFGVCDHG
jgi:hypothetical protein